MSVRPRSDGRADMYLCDCEGCHTRRASSAGPPRGWVAGDFGYYHLCTFHKHLKSRYDQIVRVHGVRALTGLKGPG